MKAVSSARLAPAAAGVRRMGKVLQKGVTDRSGSWAPSRSGRGAPSTRQPVPARSRRRTPWPRAFQRSTVTACARQCGSSRQRWSRRKPPASRQSTVDVAVMPPGSMTSSRRSSPSTSVRRQKRTEVLMLGAAPLSRTRCSRGPAGGAPDGWSLKGRVIGVARRSSAGSRSSRAGATAPGGACWCPPLYRRSMNSAPPGRAPVSASPRPIGNLRRGRAMHRSIEMAPVANGRAAPGRCGPPERFRVFSGRCG